jgi:plastocyanin
MKKWFGATLACTIGAFAIVSGGDINFAEGYQATPATTMAATTQSAAGPRLEIKQFQFSQLALTVPVGTTVTWVNRDDDSHTVTADDGRFTSAGLDRGEQFSYRFTAAGAYAYHCALHPHMTARIVVK